MPNINSFLNPIRFTPTGAPGDTTAAANLFQTVAQGGGNSGLSTFAKAGGVAASIGTVLGLLSPQSALGQNGLGLMNQYLPNVMTPTVASIVQNSTMATQIAGAMGGGNVNSSLQTVARTQGTNEASVVANMGPGIRDMYNQLLIDDPKQARAFLIQEMMASLKLMGEILSNVSKTRAEISMTFARNARA